MAIGAAYHARAKLLCDDLRGEQVEVFTDKPEDFSSLQAVATRFSAEGLMAEDYIGRGFVNGVERGAVAYHDKRRILRDTLRRADTVIFADADCRMTADIPFSRFPAGLGAVPWIRHSVAQHLLISGGWRRPIFEDLVRALGLGATAMESAPWVAEWFFSLTSCPQLDTFFDYWDLAANHLNKINFHYGEGGVIGLSALAAGLNVDLETMSPFVDVVRHEGGGPKIL